MKYSKQILVLLILNFFIALLMIFVAQKTRKIELSNKYLKKEIINIKEEIIVNEIEFAFHNNGKYLKKIHSLYQEEMQFNEIAKIINIDEIDLEDQFTIIQVGN